MVGEKHFRRFKGNWNDEVYPGEKYVDGGNSEIALEEDADRSRLHTY